MSHLFPFTIRPENEDEKFMLEALKEAYKSFLAKEVPVGAVLVHKQSIIARGHNQVELLQDATAHAEMLCLTAGAVSRNNWRLSETTLYCTIEPCAMCAGAMLLSRVPTLVWGAPDIRHGANGSWIDLFEKPHPTHTMNIRRGVWAKYCALLMREFFQQQRLKKKNSQEKSPQNN
jgi:tRNA(adenine34) deaminase